jgi:1,4-alpha-glucan branching enzyme
MFGQPGKKLLFMGDEFAQGPEWSHEASLAWQQLEQPLHAGVQRWVADLNRLYRTEPALYDQDCDPRGFAWIDCSDPASSIISFTRKGSLTNEIILVVCNFTPVVRTQYPVGVPFGGFWEEVLNSDAPPYGGSGAGNCGGLLATATPYHNQAYSLSLTVPPLAVLFFKGTPPSDAPVSPSQLLGQ